MPDPREAPPSRRRRRGAAAREASQPAGRVLPIELFLDLAFVFTITQLTALISHNPSIAGVLQALLVGQVLWWMFDGYTWLTNAVPPSTPALRGLLLLAMAAYLVLARLRARRRGLGAVVGRGASAVLVDYIARRLL